MTSSHKGRVVRFRGGRHREVRELLPWRRSNQLDAAERERVEAHLKVCAECQAEVRFQERLGDEIAHLPLDVELSWAAMRRQMAAEAAPRRRAWSGARLAGAAGVVWRSSPAWGGWAASSVLLVAAAVLWLRPIGSDGAFHALSAKPAAAPAGDMVAVFRPDTPERAMSAALNASGARIVDGPTEADAYVLFVPRAQRERALAALRARPEVVMAEPVDGPAPR